MKTAEEAQLQRKCVKCAKLVLWTCMSEDYRELFGFCARHFIVRTTEKADGYQQVTAWVSLQLVPVLVNVEQVSKEKILKCGEAFFQTPTFILSCNTGVAVASRVGYDPATTVSSAMMNLKGFSVQSVSAVI